MEEPRRPLIAGNWKMNGTRAEALTWARSAVAAAAEGAHEVALFPPYPLLEVVAEVVDAPGGPVGLGAQACHASTHGAYTGAVSAAMLVESGCRYVLCGHSERRSLFGEGDDVVAASMAQALGAGLVPVLCVGETLEEREAGRTRDVILRQLDAGLAVLSGPEDPLLIAYEPVWAIGSGRAATPVEAGEAHAWIRQRVAEADPQRAAGVRILYGGSVNADNIGGFLGVEDVDGALIGGASLDPDGFARIIGAAPAGAADGARPPAS